MGTNIVGYVEINSFKESAENLWFEIVKIDVVAERNYGIYGNLFGVRQSGPEVVALAPSRGIPEATSNSSSLMCKQNTYIGHTWVDWSELKGIKNLISTSSECLGWCFIFSCVETLSDRYGENNVRLVVAFDNHG